MTTSGPSSRSTNVQPQLPTVGGSIPLLSVPLASKNASASLANAQVHSGSSQPIQGSTPQLNNIAPPAGITTHAPSTNQQNGPQLNNMAPPASINPQAPGINQPSVVQPHSASQGASVPPTAVVGRARQERTASFRNRFKRFFVKSEPKEWVSRWLHPVTLGLFFLLTVALWAGIVTVKVISDSHNGLANVSNQYVNVLSYQVGQSLLWTFIPVFTINLYGLGLAAIVAAMGDRQPFVEMRKEQGGLENVTILSDYRASPTYVQPFIAVRNRNLMLSLTFTMNFLFTIFLASLASHLFTPSTIMMNHEATTSPTSTFNGLGFGARSDLTSIFDIVSSTRVFDGLVPGWANSEYSFQSFANPTGLDDVHGTADFQADTVALSSSLRCEILNESQYHLQVEAEEYAWFLSTKGDCALSNEGIVVTNVFENYFQTFANVDCSLDAGMSRLFVFAAETIDENRAVPHNVTVLSCETKYFETLGRLNVTYGHIMPNFTIQDFTEHSTLQLDNPRPVYWQNFEQQLHQASIVDNTAVTSATDFGRIIDEYAKKVNPDNFLKPELILNATVTLFNSVHAVMASKYLWEATSAAAPVQGNIGFQVLRLVVVDSIATILICTFAILAVLILWIALYVINNKSSLYEPPRGLLSLAVLLQNSETNELAATLRKDQQAAADGRVLRHAKKNKAIGQGRWRVDDWDRPESSRIVRC